MLLLILDMRTGARVLPTGGSLRVKHLLGTPVASLNREGVGGAQSHILEHPAMLP